MRIFDLSGQVFSSLTVLKEAQKRKHLRVWECGCICGKVISVYQCNLRSGHTVSCGCVGRGKHKMSRTRIYSIWKNMKNRCNSPTSTGWANYGGRGVIVCERWVEFDTFYKDMGEPPSPKHSLDRENYNGNYEPGNCRWATQKEQMRNMRANHLVPLNGKMVTLMEAVESLGLKYNTILYRIIRGWPIEEALYGRS